eukprot:10858205-Lingulodinium_polyedra.AAC.1
MLHFGDALFENARSWCTRCNKLCRCSTWGDRQNPQSLTCVTAGSVCVAFTKMGKRGGTQHSTMKSFVLWRAETLTLKPDIVIHENAPECPFWMIEYFLGKEYNLTTMVVSPSDLGWPMQRRRRYTIMCRRGAAHFTGSAKEFFELLKCNPAVTGNVFFAASKSALDQHVSEMARKRKRDPCM